MAGAEKAQRSALPQMGKCAYGYKGTREHKHIYKEIRARTASDNESSWARAEDGLQRPSH